LWREEFAGGGDQAQDLLAWVGARFRRTGGGKLSCGRVELTLQLEERRFCSFGEGGVKFLGAFFPQEGEKPPREKVLEFFRGVFRPPRTFLSGFRPVFPAERKGGKKRAALH